MGIYSFDSPIQMTWMARAVACSSGTPVTAIIPVPPGWTATIRAVMVQITTTLAASSAPWGLVQIGDGVTVNKYAQLQLGNSTYIPTAGQQYCVSKQPPLAGVNSAGVAGDTTNGYAQSGLTGRNPSATASSGISGPFLFSYGAGYVASTGVMSTDVAANYGIAANTGTTGNTGFLITSSNQGGTPSGGAFDIMVLIELSNQG